MEISPRTLGTGVVVLIAALAIWFFLPRPILGKNPELFLVTQGSEAAGTGTLRVQITKTVDSEYDLRASIDWNKNGQMEDSELVADDIPFTPKKGDPQDITVTYPEGTKDGSSYTVLLSVFKGSETESTESLETELIVKAYDARQQ